MRQSVVNYNANVLKMDKRKYTSTLCLLILCVPLVVSQKLSKTAEKQARNGFKNQQEGARNEVDINGKMDLPVNGRGTGPQGEGNRFPEDSLSNEKNEADKKRKDENYDYDFVEVTPGEGDKKGKDSIPEEGNFEDKMDENKPMKKPEKGGPGRKPGPETEKDVKPDEDEDKQTGDEDKPVKGVEPGKPIVPPKRPTYIPYPTRQPYQPKVPQKIPGEDVGVGPQYPEVPKKPDAGFGPKYPDIPKGPDVGVGPQHPKIPTGPKPGQRVPTYPFRPVCQIPPYRPSYRQSYGHGSRGYGAHNRYPYARPYPIPVGFRTPYGSHYRPVFPVPRRPYVYRVVKPTTHVHIKHDHMGKKMPDAKDRGKDVESHDMEKKVKDEEEREKQYPPNTSYKFDLQM